MPMLVPLFGDAGLTAVFGMFMLGVLVRVCMARSVGVSVFVDVLDVFVGMRMEISPVLMFVAMLFTLNQVRFHAVIIVDKSNKPSQEPADR